LNPKCDSRRFWWTTIEQIAEQFEVNLKEIGKKYSVSVQLDINKLKEAFEIYELGWWTFKEYVYGQNAKKERIDRHKIAALYILSFLMKRPFSVKVYPENEDVDRKLFLANELFSLAIMQLIIFGWEKDFKVFQMDKEEKKWFVILLNYFKLNFVKSNPSHISDDPSSVSDILSLSQIIYYIEKSYT
jgi:hypothetical protein